MENPSCAMSDAPPSMKGVSVNMARTHSKPKSSLKQQAYEYIKHKILNCEYMPSELINEQLLCEEMGNISRTPVRDALSHLEQEGLVTIIPKKGSYVAGLNHLDIKQIYEIRSLLEPYAIQKYGYRIPRETFLHFRELFLTLSKDGRESDYLYDDQFHMTIINAVDNPYLRRSYQTTADINYRFRIISGEKDHLNIHKANREHIAIIDACLDQNWDLARQLMINHLESSRISSLKSFIDFD